MIRLIKRRLIIPRGDTGSFTIPTLTTVEQGDVAVFSVYDPLTKTTILEKEIAATNDTLTIPFVYEDTINLRPGKYLWDIKIYIGPQYDLEGKLIGGNEIHSYYAGYKLPIFEVRQTGDNLPLFNNTSMNDLSTTQLSAFNEMLARVNTAINQVNNSLIHFPKIENNYWYVWDTVNNTYVNTNVKAAGSDATTNYTDLINKPQINSVTLNGNVTLSDLDIASTSAVAEKADKKDTVLDTYLEHGVSESSEGTGQGSIAFGEDVDASGNAAVAFGNYTAASGDGSAAFGLATVASGYVSAAFGIETMADSQGGFTSGTQTIARGDSAFAEGLQSTAWGMGSHAGGLSTIADADGMCSIGIANAMPNSYPMWTSNTAYNVGDVVNWVGLGYKCIEANNDKYFQQSKWQLIGPGEYSTYPIWVPGASYAVGDRVVYRHESNGFVYQTGLECTVANSDEQPAFNKWKSLPSTGPIAFVVGNGDMSGSNAFRVDWDGNAYLNGDLRIGCEPDSTGGKSLASLFEMIAPIEGSTASQAYPGGSAFITNGEFCMAVSNIAAGDTFAVYREGGENNPGTPNCVKMTLAQYIRIYGMSQGQLVQDLE